LPLSLGPRRVARSPRPTVNNGTSSSSRCGVEPQRISRSSMAAGRGGVGDMPRECWQPAPAVAPEQNRRHNPGKMPKPDPPLLVTRPRPGVLSRQ